MKVISKYNLNNISKQRKLK